MDVGFVEASYTVVEGTSPADLNVCINVTSGVIPDGEVVVIVSTTDGSAGIPTLYLTLTALHCLSSLVQ